MKTQTQKLFCILIEKKDEKYNFDGRRIYFSASSRDEAQRKGINLAKEANKNGCLLIQVT